ncbi:MAG TPA: zinc-ribbon domain-containing protein [Kofleriaceae bacterium]|nr:zinc-ribbon domain-containing protein [Kofleriaceae bacterium]
MDVRCEKCQTEYELDEARLKPGGVTVKCTNCGHMFKIRRRATTDVGTPTVAPRSDSRARTASSRPLPTDVMGAVGRPRPDSLFDDDGRPQGDEAPASIDRQWMIRLENGDQKSCRELATLQQWIITGVVTRESLISRTGKTWKRLGDIADLGQYFTIADEARANRDRNRVASRATPVKEVPSTLPGFTASQVPGYSAPQAAGGTILPDDPDDDDQPADARKTRAYRANTPPVPPPVPPRGAARTPPVGASITAGETILAMAPPQPTPPPRRLQPTPPPPPPRRPGGETGPAQRPPAVAPATVAQRPPAVAATPPAVQPPVLPPAMQPPPLPPPGSRATAAWATDAIDPATLTAASQSVPFMGKLAAIPDEPAFAGRVRMSPSGEPSFDSGRVRSTDEDDALFPARRGSRAGMLVLAMALIVMGAAATVVYVFVIRGGKEPAAVATPRDAAVVATVVPDAAQVVTVPAPDAAPELVSALEAARGELGADIEPRLQAAIQALEGKDDVASQGLRAHLMGQLAQDFQDRASVAADRALADALRKDARQLVLDAANAAQRALKAAGDDAGANLAMAEVLRLQGKPARDVKRYLDTARARADKGWTRELALADALVLARDGKLDEARAGFAAIDQGEGKLETSGDVRARYHLALTLAAQNKTAEAKPLVQAVLAAQPEHLGAKALAAKLETEVARTDPLPPEEGKEAGKETPARPPAGGNPTPRPAAPPEGGGAESYDRLLKRANEIADTNCVKAMDLYAKALEQKPNGVEALVGMGYCHIDAKQFASAFSKFRAALVVSPRYEPALRGVAEAYQQQGRKEQAIEAYKAYLEIYPGNAAAKKQLERLGGDSAASTPSAPAPAPSGSSGGGAGSATAAPPPPPPSPPPASPPSEAAGQGSGSG